MMGFSNVPAEEFFWQLQCICTYLYCCLLRAQKAIITCDGTSNNYFINGPIMRKHSDIGIPAWCYYRYLISL